MGSLVLPLMLLRVCAVCALPAAQAEAKLKDVEAAMVRHFQQHAERAGLGLELLPGVKRLLEALKVRHAGCCSSLLTCSSHDDLYLSSHVHWHGLA